MSYREYFNIDPEFFPQVDKKIIDTQPDLWKKFYPHPSFIQMLKTIVDILKRKQKLSMWVDGAFGTGKSHAVLTLKKLLEASRDDTIAYFQQYGLDDYLCKSLLAEKDAGKILICHRYGSSDINSDTDLIIAIQESIEKALKDNGIDNQADMSLKNALIRYFEDEDNKTAFDIFANGKYKDVLGGDKANDILRKLRTYQDEALRALIAKLFKVPHVKNSFTMNTGELCDWIREVIEKNSLHNLIFMWDEFSEYFENNMHHLTGFQQIAELAATAKFCLMIVTHKAEAYFSDSDPDKRKILDRFVPPVHVSLPENIAFELMAQALCVTDDAELAAKWHKNKASLEARTMRSRNAVRQKIGLSEADLSNVLPIHPYAALLLQHISVYYTSTARSMFNFIKNDEGDDVHAFQWFIDNFDFRSQNPYITVDMLWSFFYDHGRDKLATGIKDVLDCYTSRVENSLMPDEKRVLKAILLLQAVSERMTGNKDIFLPNTQNLSLAFEGTDLQNRVLQIANKLLNDHVVTRTPLTGDVFSYCCKNAGPSVDTAPFIDMAKGKSTKDLCLVPKCELKNTVELSGALRLRYLLSYATLSDFDSESKKANNPSDASNRLYAIVTIAKNATERIALQKKIKSFFETNPESDVVVIDTSNNDLGEESFNEFVENFAMALAIGQSDMEQRRTYEGYATEVLNKWAKRIKNGDFYIYSRYAVLGERAANASELQTKLMEINRFHYPECLEAEYTSVIPTMFDANSLGVGATCGITEETKSTFRSSSEVTKLENALRTAWKKPNYWTESHDYIARLKMFVDGIIQAEYATKDRISISQIYHALKSAPYGFMPCNLTAFILGFILKEYANAGIYSYSDNLTTVPLDADKLANMISEIIKLDNTPNPRYRDKFIVTLTEAERTFNRATATVFGIDEQKCVSITETRRLIREKMKEFSFPIWLIKYTIDDVVFRSSKDIVCTLIDYYCGIANNKNLEGEKSDTDIAIAIGELCRKHPDAIEDLKVVLTKDTCRKGMLQYLTLYREGMLPALARVIGDGGQYINNLAYKFSSDAANWVWNQDTVHAKIDDIIIEYEIIELSNKILTKNETYLETIRSWCSKIDQICVAYSVIRTELGEAKPFYEMLFQLKKANNLLDSQKKQFLESLRGNIEHFKLFLQNQSEWFLRACSFYLDDLDEADVKQILDDDRYSLRGTYTVEQNVYTSKVQSAVAVYKASLKHVKLRRLWQELTGTESPYAWSIQYRMPIFAMVPSDEMAMARRAFATINQKSTNDADVEFASEYISKMSYLDVLNDEAARDRAFAEQFLREFSILFDNVAKVKEYLCKHSSEEPYYWLGSKEIEARIRSMSKAKYNETGYDRAKQLIDVMSPEQAKEYLKQLIEDNIAVGMEIIRGKN